MNLPTEKNIAFKMFSRGNKAAETEKKTFFILTDFKNPKSTVSLIHQVWGYLIRILYLDKSVKNINYYPDDVKS